MKWSWRYLKSFLSEEVLEVSSSPYNARLEVWYAWGRTVVNAANVNLSFGSLDKVFRDAFSQLGIREKPYRDVLLLGLGAGNVPTILGEFGKEYRITGVEIDAEMVRLARKWCGLDAHTHLEVVIADAMDYVRGCGRDFDLVIVDLFVDALVPAGAEAEDFLRQLAGLVRPGGMLLFNRLMHTAELQEQSLIFTRKMQETLPETTFIKAHTNRMLIYAK